MKSKIKTGNVRIAQIRWFDKNKNASEIPDLKAYAIMARINGIYINVFNPFDELPIYDRLPYTNSTKDGESFGTKLTLLSGEIEDGPCYILEKGDFSNIVSKAQISLDDLKQYVINSSCFFPDRLEILNSYNFLQQKRYGRIIKEDTEKMLQFDDYLHEHRQKKVYAKDQRWSD